MFPIKLCIKKLVRSYFHILEYMLCQMRPAPLKTRFRKGI